MVDMNPADVARISQELKVVGDEANVEIGRLFATGTAAAAGNQGWQSSAAMTRCVDIWRTALRATVDQIRANATNLATSASLTAALDREGERRLRAVLTELANK